MKIFRLVLLLTAVTASGCATLFVENIKTITINSEPASAEVKDKSGKVFGSTPYSFTPSKEKNYSFVISKSGFTDAGLEIKPVVNDGALLADALLLCVPCIVDVPSKAYLQFPRSNYKVELEHAPSGADDAAVNGMEGDIIYVNIEEPEISFKNREVVGKLNGTTKKYKEEQPEEYLGSSTFYTDVVCSEFEKSNIMAMQCGLNRYALGNTSLVPPEKQLHIAAEVQSYNFDLKYKSHKFYGTGSLTVTWKIKDPAAGMKTIREKKISVTSDIEERQVKYVFRRMLERSANHFITEDSVVDFLRNRVLVSPELMKGEMVSLKKTGNPSFPKFKDLVSYCTKAVVTIKLKDGFGSGVVISSSGFIITNYHVVDENKEVKVKLNTGISLTARVIKTNPAADLALLKVDAQDLPALPFSSSEPETGDEVIAIGTPGDLSLEQTVSKGIVSGKRTFDGKKFLQTDVSINPGNSGGPLIDEKGAIAGIITMKLMGRGMEGLGFALTTEEVIKSLNLKIE